MAADRLRTAAGAAAVRKARSALERAAGDTQAQIAAAVAAVYEATKGLPPDEMLRVVREASEGLSASLVADIEAGVLKAAKAGARASWLGLVAIVGRRNAPPPEGWQSVARSVLSGHSAPGGLPLSRRVHMMGAGYRARLDEYVSRAVAAGDDAMTLAQRLLDDSVLRVSPLQPGRVADLVPTMTGVREGTVWAEGHFSDLRAAARSMASGGGDAAAAEAARLLEEIKRAAAAVSHRPDRLSGTTHAAYQEAIKRLEAAVQTGNAKAIDKAAKWWLHDKAQYHAKVVARTEMQRAYAQAFAANARQAGYVKALVWNTLDGGCCDVCRENDQREFPLDDLPEMGAHPSCRCYWTHAIDRAAAFALLS